MRFFSRQTIVVTLGIAVILGIAAVAGIIAYLESPAFEARARGYIVEELERQTGARVTLGSFQWSLWQRRIVLGDLTLRGLEPADSSPLAHINRIDMGLHFRSLLQHRIDLFELTITHPGIHVLITPDGKTNVPAPTSPRGQPSDFQISIQNFNIVDGLALLNERRLDVDLSLQNLTALLKWHNTRDVLEAHFRYDGVLDRSPGVKLPIPYTISADLDYTRATIIAHRLVVTSGQNQMKLQGKINQVLSADISGKLDYTGTFLVRFLNYFFEAEKFNGKGAAAGFLEFSREHFSTQGNFRSDAIDYEGWHTTDISSEYTYRFPDRRLTAKNLKNRFGGGSVSGEASVENLPGPSRVLLNLGFANIDAGNLTRAYPWDPKYRIFSEATGTINGWFEGKLARFDLSGHADLKSYAPPIAAGIVALPLDGSADYNLTPGAARVANAEGRFYSTSVKADGLIHPTMTDLKITMNSSDLKDLAFLYSDANGSGSFSGSITGAIAQPILDGQFALDNHTFRQQKIEHAAGGVKLDMRTEDSVLKDVRVRSGQSEILINGTAALSGKPIDVRIQSNHVDAQDLRPFTNRNDLEGIFAGDLHVTEISPKLQVEGDVRADDLAVDHHPIGNARGHVRFVEPAVDISQLTVQQGNSTLSGNLAFNRDTEAVRFQAVVNSVDLRTFYPIGLPDTIKGVVRQANVRGDGTVRQPNVQGTATLQNVSAFGQAFPDTRIDLTTNGSKLNAQITAGPNLNVRSQIDTSMKGYPFTANVAFTDYRLDQIANVSEATMTATGTADLSGELSNPSSIHGNGRINRTEIRLRDNILSPTAPFTFSFTPTELTVSDVTLTGQSTQVALAGTIGLRDPAPLNLKLTGQVDLKLIEARYPELLSSGSVNLQVDVRGTVQNPDLRGTAVIANASLRRQGLFTGLTNVNGTLSFNQNQIRLNNIQGTAGGGTIRAEGTALLQGNAIQSMNIQIDGTEVRLRGYPEGLRTVINANLNLRGSLASPLLEGNVAIQSLAFKSGFEDFLSLLNDQTRGTSSTPLGPLRLSLHVEGGKNITIQNQLATVEARVDVDLKGTVADPSLTGHVEASGGTLLFQGNRYTVTRGNIDFVNPIKIEPVIDIEAESQVRDYRVILSITGRGDNPKLSMRSDPPLPELEIVSLIAGGTTRGELQQRSGEVARSVTSERLFQSGAASILFDLLQQRVGNRVGLLGSGRVRIDPFLVGAENNPGARVTLSEQVTTGLTVTYSQDVSSSRQQVILIEYFISRNTSIVASRDETGSLGLDIRHRTRIK